MKRLITASLLLLLSACGGSEDSQIDQYAQMIYNNDWHVTICHYPPGNPGNPQTITVGHPAVLAAHLKNHDQDHLGECTCEDFDNCGPVCGNEQCEESESCESCSSDCGTCEPTDYCGDQVCNGNETCETCSSDCGECPPPPPVCGDEVCNGEETCSSCPSDCGECETYCGNEVCNINETCETCTGDCGECPPPRTECGDGTCDITESCENCSSDCGECPEPPVVNPPVTPPTPPAPTNRLAYAGGCNVAGVADRASNISGLLTMALFLFAAWAFSRVRPLPKWRLGIVLGLFILCTSALVYAFPTNNLKPAPGSNDTWATESPKVSLPQVGFLYHYENDPLRLINLNTGNTMSEIITDRHNLHILGAYSFFNMVQVGLDVPLVLNSNVGGGIGNVRLLGKLQVFNYQYFQAGLGLDVGLPSSTVRFVDDEGYTVTPKLLLGTKLWKFDFVGNAGVILTDPGDVAGTAAIDKVVVDSKFTASVGTRFHAYEGETVKVNVLADVITTTPFRDTTERNLPLELLSGLEANLGDNWSVRAGVGTGLTYGVGTPDYRILGGLTYRFGSKPCRKTITLAPPVLKIVKQPPVVIPVPVPVKHVEPVYFAFDKSDLSDEAQQTILGNIENIQWINENMGTVKVVVLYGSTDKRGSDKYNQRLGQRRAEAVKAFMVSQGFNPDQIETVSHGERFANQDTTDEVIFQQDRHVTTVLRVDEE